MDLRGGESLPSAVRIPLPGVPVELSIVGAENASIAFLICETDQPVDVIHPLISYEVGPTPADATTSSESLATGKAKSFPMTCGMI